MALGEGETVTLPRAATLQRYVVTAVRWSSTAVLVLLLLGLVVRGALALSLQGAGVLVLTSLALGPALAVARRLGWTCPVAGVDRAVRWAPVAVLGAVGWAVLGAARGPAAAALAELAAVAGVSWWHAARVGAAAGPDNSTLAPRQLLDLLRQIPTEVLLDEWGRTGSQLARGQGTGEQVTLCLLRAMLLDELERRDADGFAAWQAAAGVRACGPEEFLGRQEHRG